MSVELYRIHPLWPACAFFFSLAKYPLNLSRCRLLHRISCWLTFCLFYLLTDTQIAPHILAVANNTVMKENLPMYLQDSVPSSFGYVPRNKVVNFVYFLITCLVKQNALRRSQYEHFDREDHAISRQWDEIIEISFTVTTLSYILTWTNLHKAQVCHRKYTWSLKLKHRLRKDIFSDNSISYILVLFVVHFVFKLKKLRFSKSPHEVGIHHFKCIPYS